MAWSVSTFSLLLYQLEEREREDSDKRAFESSFRGTVFYEKKGGKKTTENLVFFKHNKERTENLCLKDFVICRFMMDGLFYGLLGFIGMNGL